MTRGGSPLYKPYECIHNRICLEQTHGNDRTQLARLPHSTEHALEGRGHLLFYCVHVCWFCSVGAPRGEQSISARVRGERGGAVPLVGH